MSNFDSQRFELSGGVCYSKTIERSSSFLL